MKSSFIKNALTLWGGVCAVGLLVKKYKEHEEIHKGTKHMGMLWKDENDYIYNSKGRQIGRVWFEESDTTES